MDSGVFPGERGEVILQTPGPSELPIDEYRDEIINALESSSVVFIESPTGTGKSTRVPVYAMESGIFDQAVVSQPRTVATRELCQQVDRVADGEFSVGYFTSRESSIGNQADQDIAYITDGKLAKQMLYGRHNVGQKTLLVIDEVHEWSVHTEMLIALAAEQTNPESTHYNPDLKVVIMSATMEGYSEGLQQHFSHTDISCVKVRNPSPYQVETIYVDQEITDSILETVPRDPTSRNLAFLPGTSEIRDNISRLNQGDLDQKIYPLHSRLPKHRQQLATAMHPEGAITLATNIAETSLTIPGVSRVFDTGLHRTPNVDYSQDPTGIDELILKHAPVTSILQRLGRTGRNCPGVYYAVSPDGVVAPLTLNQRRAIQEYKTPDIHQSRLDGLVLSIADTEYDVDDLPFYHKPTPEALNAARVRLFNMGALDELGKTTRRGRIMNRLPVDPELACMLAMGAEEKIGHRAMSSLVTIAAIMSLGGIIDRSPKRQAWKMLLESDDENNNIDHESDFFAQLEVYARLINDIPEDEWRKYHVNENAASVIERDRKIIADRLNVNLKPTAKINKDDKARIQRIINVSRISQLWQRRGEGWVNIFTGMNSYPTASSVVGLRSGQLATGSVFRLGSEGISPESDGYFESIVDITTIPNIDLLRKHIGHLIHEEPDLKTTRYDVDKKIWLVGIVRKLGNLALDETEVNVDNLINPVPFEDLNRVYIRTMFIQLRNDKTLRQPPLNDLEEAQRRYDHLLERKEKEQDQANQSYTSLKMDPRCEKDYARDQITGNKLYAYMAANGRWVSTIDSALISLAGKIHYLKKQQKKSLQPSKVTIPEPPKIEDPTSTDQERNHTRRAGRQPLRRLKQS